MYLSCKSIKIETYWNVNSTEDEKEKNDNPIKIETYWNVNEEWGRRMASELN